MNRRTFPAGQTHSALIKAMLASLDEQRPGEANAWLASIHLVREDLKDETKQVPLVTLHHALMSYSKIPGVTPIADLWRYLVRPDCLGVWMRVLRGTTVPQEALMRLDASDSEFARTTRWETKEGRTGYWRGRVTVAHDPILEDDGLFEQSRAAELRAIIALFGVEVATVMVGASRGAAGQEYEVRWRAPSLPASTLVGSGIGAILGIAPTMLLGSGTAALGAWSACLLAGGLLGAARGREQQRRAEAHAQAVRVHALERSLVLKESRDRSATGYIEGSVVAGLYRIKTRMGSGASGVIYEAERISDGLPVAIKLLRAAAAHEAVASDRLRREAEALGLSWHPNVVELIDQGHLPDGTAYLVMELLYGEALATRIKNKGKLSPEELLPIGLAVCDALAAVHAAGVLHRDLKPSNIFLAIDKDQPDAPERVKIIDFGIARVEWEETRITHTGGLLGTPGYMSPEQEVGGELDARTDLFALGSILYECLVGEPPPPTSSLARSGEGPALSARLEHGMTRAQLPPDWRQIIEKATAALPEQRFADARAFAAALRALGSEALKSMSS